MRTSESRPGFSLIEMMVVMTIIVVLAAIATGVYFKFIDVQQGNNTNTQLNKVHSILLQRMKTENDLIKSEIKAGKANALLPLTNNDPRVAEVLYAKLRMRQAFPMNFAEALNLKLPLGTTTVQSPLPPISTYVNRLKEWKVFNPPYPAAVPNDATDPYVESAACLLLALQRGTSGGGVDTEDLGGAATADLTYKYVDTGSGAAVTTTVKGLVDGFGSPLVFCRWPTDCTELTPNLFPGINNDVGDPEGQLLKLPATPAGTSTRDAFMTLCHKLPPATASQSYKLTPIIVSIGQDKRLGLEWKTFKVAGTNANDNVYSTSAP
jgi:prepilin-type N-terminal cleavage/methylation domain-containing protein